MVEEYISVAEYAKRAGISKQEVYNLIRSPQYQPYTQKINGKIQIAVSMFEAVESHAEAPERMPIEESKEDAEAPVKETDNRETAIIDFLMKQVEELREEIRSKDKQIAEHNARIALLLEKQQELTEKALITTGQAQYLQASNNQPVVEDKPARSIWKRLFSRKE